jgi:peptidoglycan/xylan/chitin deacetylase (PgdA/CDA1 family)
MNACITIDLDNYQDYASLTGTRIAEGSHSFFDDAIPRFLDLLERAGVRATFFLVGRDAAVGSNRRWVRAIAESGHEIGNHSYTHPYNFRALAKAEREREIAQGEDAIADVVGERPVGFRTPSCDVDLDLLRMLEQRGYLYDSSVFPSPIMWVFMLYGKLFLRSTSYQLGEPLSALAPRTPYEPCPDRLRSRRRDGDTRSPRILEIPFSVLPFVRIPFYSTLLRRFGPTAFDWLKRAYGRRDSILHVVFHMIELADFEGTPLARDYRRTPGLTVPLERRQDFVRRSLESLAKSCEAVTLREFAEAYNGRRAAGGAS